MKIHLNTATLRADWSLFQSLVGFLKRDTTSWGATQPIDGLRDQAQLRTVHIHLRPAEIENQLADLAIAHCVHAITQGVAQTHCGQSINDERRRAEFLLTLD
jgi:hypothetical protein